MHVSRVEKVRESMRRIELDALIVSEAGSRFYLTGWANPDSQAGETAYWLVVDQNDLTIVSGAPNKGEVEEAVPSARFVGLGSSESAAERVAVILGESRYRRIGYDDLYLSAGDFRCLTERGIL